MNLQSLLTLPLSSDSGWPEIVERHPALPRLFLFVVLPLSALPAAMLYWSGTSADGLLRDTFGQRPWAAVAVAFFLAEILTVLAMGWLIRQVSGTYGLTLDRHDARMLAAITPIPMWLSSLGLLLPNLPAAAFVAVAGLGLSCGLMYHGLLAICRTREEMLAAGVVQSVIGAGLIAWACLLAAALL